MDLFMPDPVREQRRANQARPSSVVADETAALMSFGAQAMGG